MKDRLTDLQTFKPAEEEEVQLHGGEEDEDEDLAVVFHGEDVMDGVYKEAQVLRKEMHLLKLDVKRLGKQNSRFLTSVRRISSIKRDSNALGRDIKNRGEAVYARLQKLGKLSKDLEEEHGPTSAVSRMARSQCVSLNSAFHNVISEYNEAEMIQRENCKTRIQRQAEIMGKQVSREQINEMIETGKWNDGAQRDGENRQRELLELEQRIREIHDLFAQMASLVEEQGVMLDNIQANVGATQDYVAKANVQIKKADPTGLQRCFRGAAGPLRIQQGFRGAAGPLRIQQGSRGAAGPPRIQQGFRGAAGPLRIQQGFRGSNRSSEVLQRCCWSSEDPTGLQRCCWSSEDPTGLQRCCWSSEDPTGLQRCFRGAAGPLRIQQVFRGAAGPLRIQQVFRGAAGPLRIQQGFRGAAGPLRIQQVFRGKRLRTDLRHRPSLVSSLVKHMQGSGTASSRLVIWLNLHFFRWSAMLAMLANFHSFTVPNAVLKRHTGHQRRREGQHHHASHLQQTATHLPHGAGHPGQLAQTEGVQEGGHVLQHLEGKAAQLIPVTPYPPATPRGAWFHPEGPKVPVVDDPETLHRGAEATLTESASVIRQRTTLLHPSVQTRVDIPVHVLEVRGEFVPSKQLPAHKRKHRTLFCLVSSHALQNQVQTQRVERARVGELGVGVITSGRRRHVSNHCVGGEDSGGEGERLGAEIDVISVHEAAVGDSATPRGVAEAEKKCRGD
ncbi:hypothetical protein F7725_008755 [Dissostichus mawsoni]|uniref:t-SNARE coiled-coil homology domain-containing protein n=1 Tax=Dissostichus mawsoni TaxID=36200 RepID=A0A7J5Y813_DISMA|nr:hypothetical protein F7725_008755 [Dissostichus mawsoni]